MRISYSWNMEYGISYYHSTHLAFFRDRTHMCFLSPSPYWTVREGDMWNVSLVGEFIALLVGIV